MNKRVGCLIGVRHLSIRLSLFKITPLIIQPWFTIIRGWQYPITIPLLSLLNHIKQFKTTIIHVSFISIVVIKSSYSINLLNCFTILLYLFLSKRRSPLAAAGAKPEPECPCGIGSKRHGLASWRRTGRRYKEMEDP